MSNMDFSTILKLKNQKKSPYKIVKGVGQSIVGFGNPFSKQKRLR